MHPSDVLNSIRLQHNVDATEKEIFESFLGRIARDDIAIREIAYVWFKLNFKRAEVVSTSANEHELRPVPATKPAPARSAPGNSVSAAPRPRISPGQLASEKEKITTWKEQVRAALTMSQIMPNGEQLQDCDAGYGKKLGGVLAALVKGLPDNARIGAHRTNDQLQAVCKRYNLVAS